MTSDQGDSSKRARRSHAHSDPGVRRLKAEKIVKLVEGFTPLSGRKVLEVGCGSGHIASFIAQQIGPDGEMCGVDVVDERESSDGFTFSLVADAYLPFENATFDVVISNHVLEHVGDRAAQEIHVQELSRVLRPGGFFYLAVPNKWSVVEPHYRLPFLSWLPARFADLYVRIARGGNWYDINPPSRRRLRRLFSAARLDATDLTLQTLETMTETEPDRRILRVANAMPGVLFRAASLVVPTFVFGLEHR